MGRKIGEITGEKKPGRGAGALTAVTFPFKDTDDVFVATCERALVVIGVMMGLMAVDSAVATSVKL